MFRNRSSLVVTLVLLLAGCSDKPPVAADASHAPIRIDVDLGDIGDAGEQQERIGNPGEKKRMWSVALVGLTKSDEGKLLGMDGPGSFRIYVADDPDRTPILGTYWFQTEGEYRFKPRFPMQPGLVYQAEFPVARLRPDAEPGLLIKQFSLPKNTATLAVVESVFPSRDLLPENQLKFYIHFSASMSRGEAYSRVHLLDSAGKKVDDPFLELGEELWDADQKRFTLFIDPGRIKRGLKPREDVGPALEEGKSYVLLVDKAWRDAQGEPLKESFRKSFRVGPPDEAPVDPKLWKLVPPGPGAHALTATFPESLDHAMLHRVLSVFDADGKALEGNIAVSHEETCWRFTPKRSWRAGKHRLVVQTILEDLAGNQIGKAFDVDVFKRIEPKLKTETIELPFEVKQVH